MRAGPVFTAPTDPGDARHPYFPFSYLDLQHWQHNTTLARFFSPIVSLLALILHVLCPGYAPLRSLPVLVLVHPLLFFLPPHAAV